MLTLPPPLAIPPALQIRPSPLVQVDAALRNLRVHGRRAIRILDLGCGPGTRLLRVVRHARAMGFTAIEARGVDPAWPARAAPILLDPAIGLTFETGDPLAALAGEADHDCDLLLCDPALLDRLPASARTQAEAEIDRVVSGSRLFIDTI